MKRALLTLLLSLTITLPALAAPTNTSGPWGIDASGFKKNGFENLSTALASPQTIGRTIVVTKPMAINNKTVSGNRLVKVMPGGRIEPAAGKTLAFALDSSFDAGDHVAFGGEGTVTGLKKAGPEWFGGMADGDSLGNGTDNKAAIQKMANTGASKFKFQKGAYVMSGAVTFPNTSFSIEGAGDGLSTRFIQAAGTSGGYFFDFTLCSGPPKKITGIGFVGIESPSAPKNWNGIKLSNTNGLTFEDCWFRALNKAVDTPSATASYIGASRCTFESNVVALELVGALESNINNSTFYGNTYDINLSGDCTGTVIGNSTYFFPGTRSVNVAAGVSGVAFSNLTFYNGTGGSNPVAIQNAGNHNTYTNISIKAVSTAKWTSAVSASGSFDVYTGITIDQANYGLNVGGDDNVFTGAVIDNIGINAVFLQAGLRNLFSDIKIGTCVTGVYAYLAENTRLSNVQVSAASGNRFVNNGTVYMSASNFNATADLHAAVVGGMRLYEITSAGTSIGYNNGGAAPTYVINPYNTVNGIGDRIVNISPVVGQVKSRVCTVPGNPGTWVSEGNL